MKKQTTDALRDLLLLTVGSVLPVLLGLAATKGLFHVTANDLEKLAGAALSGIGAWAVVYITPITRRYGIGSTQEPTVDSSSTPTFSGRSG